MAKTFFDNFRQSNLTALPTSKGPWYSLGLPNPNGHNYGGWDARVAVPFRYTSHDKKTGDAYERKGIIYLPYGESQHIRTDGSVRDGVKDIEVYGAEVYDLPAEDTGSFSPRSLTAAGLNNLLNDPNNSDFSFDVKSYDSENSRWGRTGEIADSRALGRERGYTTDAGAYRVDRNNFLRNLRNLVGRKEL